MTRVNLTTVMTDTKVAIATINNRHITRRLQRFSIVVMAHLVIYLFYALCRHFKVFKIRIQLYLSSNSDVNDPLALL